MTVMHFDVCKCCIRTSRTSRWPVTLLHLVPPFWCQCFPHIYLSFAGILMAIFLLFKLYFLKSIWESNPIRVRLTRGRSALNLPPSVYGQSQMLSRERCCLELHPSRKTHWLWRDLSCWMEAYSCSCSNLQVHLVAAMSLSARWFSSAM